MQMPHVGKNTALKGDGVVSRALPPNPKILVHVALHPDSFTSLGQATKMWTAQPKRHVPFQNCSTAVPAFMARGTGASMRI